ncbi:MAG: hypothetical protein ACRDD1_18110 [Planctomycetia bacterium]
MAARIDAVCDLVRAAILASLPESDDTVVIADDPTPTLLNPEDIDAIRIRTAYVLPAGYLQVQQLSRTKELAAYRVIVLVANRFLDPGEPTDQFARQEKTWVQDRVYDPLSVPTANPVTGYYCETAEVTEVTAFDLLRTRKLFWSQVDFEFRIIE